MSVETSVEEQPASRVKITATVAPSELDDAISKAARAYGREMRVPGFRKGKVPPELVIRQLGREAILEEAMREGLPGWYEKAIFDSGVAPVGEPTLDVAETPGEGEALEFTIEIGVRPTAELGDYKGLEVGKAKPEAPPGSVEGELDRMRESHASLNPVERAAESGDHVSIDFIGRVDGEPFEGGEAKDYLLELGSGSFIPGFEEQLTGASAGDEREVEVTFPEEYQSEELAGKDAVFSVTVNEVRAKELPDLDDDFAADNSDFDTVEELRSDIEGKIVHAMEHRVEEAFREAALDAAVEAATIDVPDEIVSARAEEVWERVERQIQQQGMDPNMYLQFQGKTREQAIDDARPDAEKGLRREAVLTAVAEAEGIEPTEEELLEALEPPPGQKGKPEKLLKRLRKEGRDVMLIEEIRLRKASELVVESAEATELSEEDSREAIWTPEERGEDPDAELEGVVDAGATEVEAEAPADDADESGSDEQAAEDAGSGDEADSEGESEAAADSEEE